MNDNDRDRAVLADSSRYLSACSSLRAISVARLQNQRYSEAYEMLQKTVKNYRKVSLGGLLFFTATVLSSVCCHCGES